jgi:hypothetical protein
MVVCWRHSSPGLSKDKSLSEASMPALIYSKKETSRPCYRILFWIGDKIPLLVFGLGACYRALTFLAFIKKTGETKMSHIIFTQFVFSLLHLISFGVYY